MAHQRGTHSDADLRLASMNVDYEVNMLARTLELCLSRNTDDTSPSQEQCVTNALLHSFLLAARNLFSFLYVDRTRRTDLVAADFFDNDEAWADIRPPGPPESPEFQDGTFVRIVSKRLLHLTWDRADGQQPRWPPWKIAVALAVPLIAFVENAPSTRVEPALRKDVEDSARLIDRLG